MLAFSINRESFLLGLSRVQSIVERKNTVPILSNVLLDGTGERLKLLATDMEVGISGHLDASIKSEGAITISARKLFEIIKELPAEANINFRVNEENVSEITCGNSSFELKGLSAQDFPNLPSYDESTFLTLDASELKEMIKRTIYAASTDETRYNLTGVLFEMEETEGNNIVRMVATDGHRLALIEKTAKGDIRPGESVVIPRKSLIEVRRLLDEGDESIELDFQKQHGVFRKDSIVLTTRLIDMSFPNYQQVIPTDKTGTAIIEREILMSAIKRVSILSSERSRAVGFSFSGQSLTVHTNNPDLGAATESVPIAYDGNDIEATFNARYMLDTLSSMSEDEIQIDLKDNLSPCRILQKDDISYVAVIMPMRL
ncbi:MAG: DNA polymerase III subunit beta [Deltaproteobacteria bacterium]|nr:DNA polymerase III subunit beta [Deltaproteobacteria bacterium]